MLYIDLKDTILKQIISGKYEKEDVLPTEAQLSQTYDMSRVTVRKALEELKKDDIIHSVKGQGTRVTKRKGGYPGSLDMIALIAEVHNPFFASFMEHFEHVAEQNGSLVLFKQHFQRDALQTEDFFFRLLQRNIRNLVFWPNSDQIDFDMLNRLRAVGTNMVFFDQYFPSNSADLVCLNNHHAVTELYRHMTTSYTGRMIFIGFETIEMPNEDLREKAFIDCSGSDHNIYRIPWNHDLDQEITVLFEKLQLQQSLPTGIICCNGPLGIAVAKYLKLHGLQAHPLGAIDYLPEMEKYPMAIYRQPMKKLAEETYHRLQVQSSDAKQWQAEVCELTGDIIQF